jgi:hypothetical protein
MYSRVTQLEIDTTRVSVDEAAWLFREHVAPRLREQDGYEGGFALTTPEGKGMIVTFWDSEDGARDASGFASAELSRYVTMFAAPPGRECYELAYSDLETIALR